MASATPISDEFEKAVASTGIPPGSREYKLAKRLFMAAFAAPGKILEQCESPEELVEVMEAMSRELADFRKEMSRESASRN
jgi:hypothetical protein